MQDPGQALCRRIGPGNRLECVTHSDIGATPRQLLALERGLQHDNCLLLVG